MDCGDIVRIKGYTEPFLICCVHSPIAYLSGYPGTVRLHDLELVEEATETQRRAHLEAMASGSGNGHRTACAKQRIADG